MEPLGDLVLDTAPADLLARIDPRRLSNRDRSLEGAARLDRQLRGEDATRQALISAYGYDNPRFTANGTALRAHVRLAICLATDATFAPYACGIKAASEFRQATLRIDIRSVSRAIWAWATVNRALARSLYAARLDATGQIIGFPALANAYERALIYQLDTGTVNAQRDERIQAAAQQLGEIATDGILHSAELGRTGDGNISQQAAAYLRDEHPDWVPDELAADPEEAFAIGAADLVSEALAGVRSDEETAEMLETIAAELRRSRTQSGSAR